MLAPTESTPRLPCPTRHERAHFSLHDHYTYVGGAFLHVVLAGGLAVLTLTLEFVGYRAGITTATTGFGAAGGKLGGCAVSGVVGPSQQLGQGRCRPFATWLRRWLKASFEQACPLLQAKPTHDCYTERPRGSGACSGTHVRASTFMVGYTGGCRVSVDVTIVIRTAFFCLFFRDIADRYVR